ncbi:MAG: TauD/TfdA family dioxygenase [Actinomycetota bacterium]|nr:TauD/TfdA family dioxygenase [Actinomycetota bacterium]
MELPGEMRHALDGFAADSGPAGTTLMRSLPVGAVPPTPATTAGHHQAGESLLLAVANRLGEPVGYAQEHGGRLVQNIVPERGGAARQTSTSSAVTLAWHTETAFHPHKPRYLLLFCLRGDADAKTLLCSAADVLTELDHDTIAVLRRPRFRTRPDESFLPPGTIGELGPPLAVLTGEQREVVLTYDEDLMVGIDSEAHAALDRLGAAVRARATATTLEAGDLLVVDNHRVVHGRTPFAARFDGTDRWLLRTFVVSDLAPSAAEREGRIITTRF